MKAPNKIYINGFSAFATVPVKEGIEYIRKEALLRYLNNYKTVLNNDEELCRLEKAAAVSTIEEVVNHINEI